MSETVGSTDIRLLRAYFDTGTTRDYTWRIQQLERLRQAILDNDEAIREALYSDLHKGAEETYATETGLVLAEISHALKHLRRWMRPRRVGTNLVNWPAASRIYQDPLGVVLIIAPWNFPLQLSLLPLAAALAAGNTVVLKPSELAPATSALIDRLINACFPGDIVRVIQGDGATVVPNLIRGFRFDHIFFTGSIGVGRSIYRLAAEQLVPVTLELGGKSPVVVAGDADVAVAARRIITGKFANAGQTCIAPDYLLVHADIRDELLRQLQDTLLDCYSEAPENSPDYGRIINEKRFEVLVRHLSEGKILHGGGHDRATRYIAPTLLEDVSPDSPLMQEEIFGPLLPVFTYRTMEEALAFVRRHPDPLAFYLFTRDRRLEKTWIGALPFGGGCINNTDWHFTNPYLPFGGIGDSGIGAYHGEHSFGRFSHAKPVMRSYTFIDPRIKYP
ncbi:MAG TPA: aldehyde dehydrogenase family protein, partial [Puia sp.]|nr:aldehyde dehydrogenase family protein [Puia sp.]